jgi:hypothetical protein
MGVNTIIHPQITIIQIFHIIQTYKVTINKTLMKQLTEHLTKQKITSTVQSMNQENKFLNITIS